MRKTIGTWCYIIMVCCCIALMIFLVLRGRNSDAHVKLLLEENLLRQSVVTEMEPVCIDINAADSDTLALLPGIGPVIADRIVEYRKECGRFRDCEDIMEVSGIGEKTYEKIRNMIIVEEGK